MSKAMNKRAFHPSHYLLSLLLRLKKKSESESGFIIFITIGMVLLLGFLWTASAVISKIDGARANASESTNTGFYAAEFGLNRRAQSVRSRFEGYNLPSGTSPAEWKDCLKPSAYKGSGDFVCETVSVTASRSSQPSQKVTTLMRADQNNPSQIRIPSGEPFANLNALEYRYQVDSVAINANRLGLPSAILGLQFKSRLVPLFQFAIFYDDDADFTIPPNMTINGRVHSNADLYLNVANGYTLTINGQVTAAGVNRDGTISPNPLIRGQKDNSTPECGGTVQILRDRNLGLFPLLCNSTASRTRYNQNTTSSNSPSQSTISDWGENIQLGAPQVPKLNVPPPGDFFPTSGGLYWSRADLRVVLNVANSNANMQSGTVVTGIEVQKADGTVDNSATTALNSCAGYDPTGTTASQTNSTVNRTSNQGAGTTTSGWINVTNSTANRFRVGDVITIGDGANRDWENNVLVGPVSSNTDTLLSAANSNTKSLIWNGTTNRFRLRARVGVGAQGGVSAVVNGATIRKAVVSTSDTFYNYREKYNAAGVVQTGGNRGQYMRMLNVDIRELMNCAYNQPNLMNGKRLDDETDGGLVWYFTVKDNTNNTNNFRKYGIRLYNGRYLAPSIAAAPEIKGLTVVSNQAVYVQGDYNLKDDNTTTPVSVANDPMTIRTERWRPAAILADSINILSNRWQSDDFNGTVYNTSNLPVAHDSVTGKLLCVQLDPVTYPDFCASATDVDQPRIDAQTHRPAPAQTWVNAGFLAGTVSPSTEGSDGTGGVNNYPRFHEHWAGSVPFNYRGSFVSLFEPSYTVAPFCNSFRPITCNIYSPPIRNWDFETTGGVSTNGVAGFNRAENLPPLTPQAVYLRQERFTRRYDRN